MLFAPHENWVHYVNDESNKRMIFIYKNGKWKEENGEEEVKKYMKKCYYICCK